MRTVTLHRPRGVAAAEKAKRDSSAYTWTRLNLPDKCVYVSSVNNRHRSCQDALYISKKLTTFFVVALKTWALPAAGSIYWISVLLYWIKQALRPNKASFPLKIPLNRRLGDIMDMPPWLRPWQQANITVNSVSDWLDANYQCLYAVLHCHITNTWHNERDVTAAAPPTRK